MIISKFKFSIVWCGLMFWYTRMISVCHLAFFICQIHLTWFSCWHATLHKWSYARLHIGYVLALVLYSPMGDGISKFTVFFMFSVIFFRNWKANQTGDYESNYYFLSEKKDSKFVTRMKWRRSVFIFISDYSRIDSAFYSLLGLPTPPVGETILTEFNYENTMDKHLLFLP